jgi:hypothetical protein
VDAGILAQMRELGASEADIEAATRAQRTAEVEDFELFADNELSVRVFDLMGTQWDRAGMDGARVGLKFNRAPIFLRMAGVEPGARKQVYEDLKVMEMAALRFYGEKSE